jgi:transposase
MLSEQVVRGAKRPTMTTSSPTPPDLTATLVVAVEISKSRWLTAAHVPGLTAVKAKQQVEPSGEALMEAIARLARRATMKGASVTRIVVCYEAGHAGFWLARFLQQRGVEVLVVQPVSVPVDRRMRRAKTDAIDVDLLLRTCLAHLRGEPRVCSMVPIPDEADEDARQPGRERDELIAERVSITNRIGAILATLGVSGYDPLRRDRRQRLSELRTPLGAPIPEHARARIVRQLDRVELVLRQLAEVEHVRDTVLMQAEAATQAERMIRDLSSLRGIGAQTATVLVREGFVRRFGSAKALGSYAGLVGTPFASGDAAREQGISRAGNRRLRTAVVELAWLWRRYQPDSALARWFAERLGRTGGRMRKVLIVALARKLLIALWRFAVHGLLPEGAVAKPT